jgi:hypothetical protein
MIISNKHRFIYFFSIGNTATRSVQRLLSQYHDDPDISITLSNEATPRMKKYLEDEGTISNYQKDSQEYFLDREVTPRYLRILFERLGRLDQFEEYSKYATVRHPFILISSLARSNNLGYNIDAECYLECIRIASNDYRAHGYDPIFLGRGQYQAYEQLAGGIIIDKFLKIESLKEDIKATFPFVNVEKLQHYKHDYAVERKTSWQQNVGQAIYRHWKKDFEHFGYNLSSNGGTK